MTPSDRADDIPLEAPEADVAEQRTAVDPQEPQDDDPLAEALRADPVLEADPADVLEQSITVPLDDEDGA